MSLKSCEGGRSSPEEDVKLYVVRVTKAPAGPAPEVVRKAWLGVSLLAVRMPQGTPKLDFINGRLIGPRKTFAVPFEFAMAQLEIHGQKVVAQWFEENLPPFFDKLSFGVDEVEVVRELDPTKVREFLAPPL